MNKLGIAIFFGAALCSATAIHQPALESADDAAIQKIVNEEVAAWNAGDAAAYSRHYAQDGTFTNIYGMVFDGHDAFEKRHADSFGSFFRGSERKETIRRLRYVTPDVAIADVDTEVRDFGAMPAGLPAPAGGVLRTRLLQVVVRRGNEWWIEAYHNTPITAQTPQKP